MSRVGTLVPRVGPEKNHDWFTKHRDFMQANDSRDTAPEDTASSAIATERSNVNAIVRQV